MTPRRSTRKRMKKISNAHFLVHSHEFMADLETPVSLFLKISEGSKSAFLLESVEQGETLGRYSFLGFRPEAVYSLYEDHWVIEAGGKKKKVPFSDP